MNGLSINQSRSSRGSLLHLLDIGAGLRWWGRGLLLWLPETLRQRLTPTPVRLVIEARGDELVVSEERGRRRRELQRIPRADIEAGRVRLPKPQNRQVVLRLDSAETLSRVTSLPLAAENNLYQVVGFEIDRLTPFTLDKLYYDAHVVARQPADKSLKVRFTAVMRGVLDELLGQLKSLGVTPDIVDVAEAAGEVNLLPPAQRPRRGRAARGLRGLLLLLLLVTLALLVLLPIWQQRNVVVGLMPLVANSQQRAETTVALRDQLQDAAESSQFLLQKRNDNVSMLEILNELTLLLPDNTWVEQLIVRDNEIQVRGQSRDATALIGIIENSALFSQAMFRSPVTPDRRTGADRFFLTAQIVRGAEPTPRPAGAAGPDADAETEDGTDDLDADSPDTDDPDLEDGTETMETGGAGPDDAGAEPLDDGEMFDESDAGDSSDATDAGIRTDNEVDEERVSAVEPS